MPSLEEIRRDNGRRAIKRHSNSRQLALALGHKNGAFMTHMFGPNPTRQVTSDMARKIEDVMGLPPFSMDRENGVTDDTPMGAPRDAGAPAVPPPAPPAAPTPASAPVAALSPEVIAGVLRVVADSCTAEGVPADSSSSWYAAWFG